MAQFNLTVGAKVNQPPSQLGISNITILNRTDHVFTGSNFIDTTPPYVDPDGDIPSLVRIMNLPQLGSLELNSVVVGINDEIPWSEILNGNLIYIHNSQDNEYNDSFNFNIADIGSNTFSSVAGAINITVQSYVNQPPTTVGDNSIGVTYGTTTVLTRANFTTETTPSYSDPEGDPASRLKITSLGTQGILLLNGVQVVNNQIINFSDIDAGNLTFLANGLTAGYTNNIEFEISDSGSEQFVG